MQTLTARQLREQIDTIDHRLKELESWEKKLVAMRRRYLLEDTEDARWTLAVIDGGMRHGQGRPSHPDFAPFEHGWPGLQTTRDNIAGLKERRLLLDEQLPSKAQTTERKREADARATEIRASAAKLAPRIEAARAAVNEAARLAMEVAEDTRRLWEDNAALDKLTTDADLPRPNTPRVYASELPIAALAGALLRDYFTGGQPYRVDASLAREIRNALRESEAELVTK